MSITTRIRSTFDDPVISERLFLEEILNGTQIFPELRSIGDCNIPNDCDEKKVGKYRSSEMKCVTTDLEVIGKCIKDGKPIPTFLLAGPRERLFHDPQTVRVAIVTTGGLAPGLNCVVHSIVKRHWDTYNINKAKGGEVYGVHESFFGMCQLEHYMKDLKPSETELWLEKGGSILGIKRHFDGNPDELAERISRQLHLKNINILYVIGGDGSLTIAHKIAQIATDVCVVGIPKTMDNDVMWISESFGFKTAVEKATEIINTLNSEAESSRRVCLIELFGAESGYVAAYSALASGHVDLVIIPEEFQHLSKEECENVLNRYIKYLEKRVKRPHGDEKPHAVVVLAEGTAKILKEKGAELGDEKIKDDAETGFLVQLKEYLKDRLSDSNGQSVGVFYNRPRHYIRASRANPQDQIYCEQLGALAVDSALAGYTDFMISNWLTSYVLVPLDLVANRHKRIPPSSLFWKQVVNCTGQPSIEYGNYTKDDSDM